MELYETLPIVPLRDVVVFPHMMLPFVIGRPSSVRALEHALLKEGYSDADFYAAYEKMTDKLRPWTIDFHVAQNDGTVFGSGSHDKTGRHCQATDPNGKLDITKHAGYWLRDASGALTKRCKHICWDGCMFPNAVLENRKTWNDILAAMIAVRDAHGWTN